MSNRAHGLRSDHTIFRAPLPVDLTLEHREKDAAEGFDQGTWLVHEGDFPEVDVGMVADGHGFEDSPDCERIAGGVNSKGTRAVAIGRQANLMQWGFYGAPDRMTVPAKRAFLNAIVWMKGFRGERPVAGKKARGRTWLVQYIESLARMSDQQRADTSERSLSSYLREQFPAELVADGVDVDALRSWYAANEEYLHIVAGSWDLTVDADLAAIRKSNRKPEFLDWLLQALAADPHDERALRLAARYLGEHGKDAAAARAFVEANREFLFFSDTAGFRWLVDDNRKRRAR